MFTNVGLALLPDGRALITSRAAGRNRVLTIAEGKEPVPFLETGEETNAPMTAVGKAAAAVALGSGPTLAIAIVSIASGRVIRKISGGIAAATTMAASPDGKTLYYSASGSIWATSIDGGNERKICAGDSVTVDPDSGDLIIELNEPEGYRLQRVPKGGSPQELPIGGELRLAAGRSLSPGSVRGGRLVFPAITRDSWFNRVGLLDLTTGHVSIVLRRPDADFHLSAWTNNGKILNAAVGIRSTLWRYQPAPGGAH